MMATTISSTAALEEKKMTKFVEILVHDYLQMKGYDETGEKFAEECARAANDEGAYSPGNDTSTCATMDEANSWYSLADKLALHELLRQNAATVAGQRFTAVIEILVKKMVRESDARSRAPPLVSKSSLQNSMGKRKLVTDGTSASLNLPRSIIATLSKSTGDLNEKESNTPAVADSGESPLNKEGASKTELTSGRGAQYLPLASDEKRRAERCKKNALQSTIGGLRGNLGGGKSVRDANHKRHPAKVKRLHGHSPSPKRKRLDGGHRTFERSPLVYLILRAGKIEKQGGRITREAEGLLMRLQFNRDVIRRQHMSNENWIPDDMRTKMMRRSMQVIKENVYESLAQGSLVRREKKRNGRSELEKVKTQEKFGTKHQRPCALCERSFSEVNLVQTVPFKAIVDLRITWQRTIPHASGNTIKTSRPMLTPPQCYDEVKVCAFCSQLFHDPLGYRPTWGMQLARIREKREKLAREKERKYWDPLRKARQNR